jgi:hypothetical protein
MTNPLPFFLVAGALVAAQPASITEQYRETAQKLIAAALADGEGLARLQYLCDRIANRSSGSAFARTRDRVSGGRDEEGRA